MQRLHGNQTEQTDAEMLPAGLCLLQSVCEGSASELRRTISDIDAGISVKYLETSVTKQYNFVLV